MAAANPSTNPDAGKPPVEVRGLRKSFGDQHVLNGIDFSVEPNGTVAILGKSGTGKSVLLKLLVGLQQPDAGHICIFGEEIDHIPGARLNELRKHIGFLFQGAALYDSLTLEGNVEFPLARHTTLAAGERRQQARQLLSGVGLGEGLDKLPSEISGGMQKRVGLARALALSPQLLFLDEPTAGLDPITSAEICELIAKLRQERNMTAIVVTHDVPAARIFADRFVLLDEGKIVADGDWDHLRRNGGQFAQEFLVRVCENT